MRTFNQWRENQKRRRYDYIPQQRLLKKTWEPRKLGIRTTGPYTILQTHVNGTVTIELRPGISERLNIRRLIPYRLGVARFSILKAIEIPIFSYSLFVF
jgi:hypothetical protein